MALQQPKKLVGGAYGMWLSEKRPEFAKACEGQKSSAVSVMASKAWKEMSDADKVPFQQKFDAAKAQFEKDKSSFLAAGGEMAKGARALRTEKNKIKAGPKPQDPNRPKKPVGGAYGVFFNENRPKIAQTLPAGYKITDVSKAAGAQWKALSEENKKPYEAMYNTKMEQWKKAMEEYVPADTAEDVSEGLGDATPRSKQNTRKASPLKPLKRRAASTDNATSSAKRGCGAKPPSPEESEVDLGVLKEAQDLKMEFQLKNLMGRPAVLSSGKTQKELLEALKSSGGLVNKAKTILCGA